MHFDYRHLIPSALLVLLAALPVQSSTHSQNDDPDWFEFDVESLTAQVNEGDLHFLAQPPAEPVHHHDNVVTLDRESLGNGWVRLVQCHHNIDRVSRAQILFRKGRIRNIRITHAENIGRAWVEGASVQLSDIGAHSSLCLDAESQALSANGDGSYRVSNGPFMRRFLDGYYPMRVSHRIVLADSGLRFAAIRPGRQPGFEVAVTSDAISFDAWFEGRLRTEVDLVPDE